MVAVGGCPFISEVAGRCQAGFRPAVSRVRRCLQGIRKWPGGSPFLRAGACFRASGRPGSWTRRSPAAGGAAGGVLDARAREPMIEACGKKGPAAQGSRACGCRRPACWLRSSRRLSPGDHRAGSRRAGGSVAGAPAPPWGGGRMGGGLAPSECPPGRVCPCCPERGHVSREPMRLHPMRFRLPPAPGRARDRDGRRPPPTRGRPRR
jgi:hypothetical protein